MVITRVDITVITGVDITVITGVDITVITGVDITVITFVRKAVNLEKMRLYYSPHRFIGRILR